MADGIRNGRVIFRSRAQLTLGALLISTSAPIVLLSHASPSSAAFWRCAFGATLLRLLLVILRRRSPTLVLKERIIVAAGGFAFGINLVLWAESVKRIGAGIATVLGNTQVLFVAILAPFVLKENLYKRALFGLGWIGSGLLIISRYHAGSDVDDFRPGVIFGLASAALYGAFLLCFRLTVRDRPDRTLWVWYLTSVIAAVTCGAASVATRTYSMPAMSSYAWLFVMALISQVVGWSLITSGITSLPAAQSSALLLIQPVGAIVLGWILFKEHLPTWEGAGVLSILLGVFIVQS
jgi:drug/metabolite transporter (DMT)-like permease